MFSPKDKGVAQNTNSITIFPAPSSPAVSRPFKIQKLQVGSAAQNFIPETYLPSGEGTSGESQYHSHEYQEPAQDTTDQQPETEEAETNSDPFFYYQESDVQENINKCKHSLIGKLLSEKIITTQTIFNTLSGIWGNPTGLKVNELEGKILQIQLDKEEDL
jgi:hypothetical protein